MQRRTISPILILTVLLFVAATWGCHSRTSQSFTDEEVAQMQTLLHSREFTPGTVTLIKSQAARLAPQNYRLVLPVFGKAPGSPIVSSETIGKLPVTEVRRLASLRNLAYREDANAQAIIFQNAEQGGAPGGGGKAGCESDHQTQAQGVDIVARIEEILRHIDKSKYIFLY